MKSRKITVWFLLKNRFSTPKDEKRKNYENERNMKLQEKIPTDNSKSAESECKLVC